MPCDTKRITVTFTREQRIREIRESLARLEAALTAGAASLVVGPGGSVAFRGWKEGTEKGITDLCAFRRLSSQGSAPLRRALARAEALAGRPVDARAVATGLHSHDGGSTWGVH